MNAGDADRLRAWLADPSVAGVDPLTVGRVRARLAAGADAERSIAVGPHGTFVAREASAGNGVLRRVLELDRHGMLREALGRRLRAAATRDERVAVGLAALTELAQLLGNPLRTRAQTRAATLPPDAQARLLTEAAPTAEGADDARRIVNAIEALIADAAH